MDVNWYTFILLGLLLTGLVISVGLYCYSREFYLNNRIIIRKIYYWLIILVAFILWANNNFPFNTIPELIAMVIGVVIIDLFIFQTPDITKFMTNELKQEELEKNISQKSHTVEKMTEKLVRINEATAILRTSWDFDDFDFIFEKYNEHVLNYLKTFCNEFAIDLYSFQVETANNESLFEDNIKKSYVQIVKQFDFKLRDIGMLEKRAVKTLEKGENIEVIEKESSHVIFPHFGEYHNILFVVSSKKDTEVTGADASLLLNMLLSFDMWLEVLSLNDFNFGRESSNLESPNSERVTTGEDDM